MSATSTFRFGSYLVVDADWDTFVLIFPNGNTHFAEANSESIHELYESVVDSLVIRSCVCVCYYWTASHSGQMWKSEEWKILFLGIWVQFVFYIAEVPIVVVGDGVVVDDDDIDDEQRRRHYLVDHLLCFIFI